MGNTSLRCVSGGGGEGEAKKVRMMNPDGNIVLLDGPVEAAELMIEHINHMVVHCSTARSGAIGERPTMTILQPHEQLQPGQAYILHPIPAPSKRKTKVRPKPFSVPDLDSEAAAQQTIQKKDESSDKNQDKAKFFTQNKTRFLQRYQSRVADSFQSENIPQTPVLKSTGDCSLLRLLVKDSTDLQKDHKKDKAEDDGDVLLHLNVYMGWRPALESIPEQLP